MSDSNYQPSKVYPNACVFTVPIVLNIPIQLVPEVSSAPTTCVKPNGYYNQP